VTGNPYAAWHEHAFVVFDVETTGLGLDDEDRVVEMGAARFERGQLVKRWGSLVHPGRPIPWEATEIHGISDDDVADAPPFLGVVGDLINIAHRAYPVAYNATFDRRFLCNEMNHTALTDLSGIPMFNPTLRWLDPLVWMRKTHGIWGKNKLTLCCQRYGIDIGNAHRATDDAVATGKLMLVLRDKVHPVTLTELLRRQYIFAQRQDSERASWFRSKGIPYR